MTLFLQFLWAVFAFVAVAALVRLSEAMKEVANAVSLAAVSYKEWKDVMTRERIGAERSRRAKDVN